MATSHAHIIIIPVLKKMDLFIYLFIYFTSLLIRKCNLYLHKPAGYFLTNLCDL